MNTAQIILQQLKALDPFALHAWGAKTLIRTNDGMKFKTSGMVRWKGWVEIELNYGTDLYDINFYKIRGTEVKYTQQLEGVFVADLVRVINEVVG
jgi:hypothetical protein